MKKLLIIGASGHGRVVADCAEASGNYEEILFVDAVYPEQRQNFYWPIIGDDNYWREHLQDYEFIVAIGNNEIRHRISTEVLSKGGKLARLIHPSAVVSQYAEVGEGSVILANAVVNIGTKLGFSTIVNTGATVDHDCKIADSCHIAPGVSISGGVSVGEQSWIGVGSSVIELTNIGANSYIGAGSTVISDLSGNATYIGTPAKELIK